MQSQYEMVYKGCTFPNNTWGIKENYLIDNIKQQINKKFPNKRNIFINGTWFSPHITKDIFDEVISIDDEFDNVFFLTSVDPSQMATTDLMILFQNFGSPTVYFIGNFDSSPYEFNFISWAISQEFKNNAEVLTDIKYKFINYNRKPKFHRKALVEKIIDDNLDDYGIVTLGKNIENPNEISISIGEENKDFVDTGHWFSLTDETQNIGVPHDLLSLGNIDFWNHHFLNVVGETEFNNWDPIFVTEKTFKPIIGLRPFVINGNTRTYAWLRKYGFKTFTHYFSFVNLETSNTTDIIKNIHKLLHWLVLQPNEFIQEMYNDMLPDLEFNKTHFIAFAEEQKYKMDHLF